MKLSGKEHSGSVVKNSPGKECGKECRRHKFDFPDKEMEPTIIFLSGKFHGERSLLDCSPWGRKRVEHNLSTKQ